MALRVRVCRVDDVKADVARAFKVTGVTWPVLVVRLGGAIVATAGVCPHEDVLLAGGWLDSDAGLITCPGHGYRFEIATGRCEHDDALELRRYPVTIVGDDVYVDLL
jgi:nitrite reductase/ring-hydroxylating ferredoxin subunit